MMIHDHWDNKKSSGYWAIITMNNFCLYSKRQFLVGFLIMIIFDVRDVSDTKL